MIVVSDGSALAGRSKREPAQTGSARAPRKCAKRLTAHSFLRILAAATGGG